MGSERRDKDNAVASDATAFRLSVVLKFVCPSTCQASKRKEQNTAEQNAEEYLHDIRSSATAP